MIPFSFNKNLSIKGKNENTIDEINQLIDNQSLSVTNIRLFIKSVSESGIFSILSS